MAKGDAPATPVEAERALLREAGYTDEEISKYSSILSNGFTALSRRQQPEAHPFKAP